MMVEFKGKSLNANYVCMGDHQFTKLKEPLQGGRGFLLCKYLFSKPKSP